MEDNVQVVLFFGEKVTYNATQVAATINRKFPLLNNPLVLPENSSDPSAPIIVFSQNKTIQLSANYESVAFLFLREHYEEYKDIVVEIVELLENEGLSFTRIGSITTLGFEHSEILPFKEATFSDKEIVESEEFHVAWYKKLIMDGVKVNCWQRYLTDKENTDNLIAVFDINTPMEKSNNVTSEFVKEFMKLCFKYIENKVDKK